MILNEDYRKLHNWKYERLKPTACDVELDVSASNDYIELVPGKLGIKSRYAWDGPSGPTFDRPENMRASLFHDALCQLIKERKLDKKHRRYADQLFRQHCLEDGMRPWVAWCYYQAVRGWSRLKGM